MKQSKLVWAEDDGKATAHFSIDFVGDLTIQVQSDLPGTNSGQSPDDKHALAIRHAKLLIRNLASELDRLGA
jgi:hypothetical protein